MQCNPMIRQRERERERERETERHRQKDRERERESYLQTNRQTACVFMCVHYVIAVRVTVCVFVCASAWLLSCVSSCVRGECGCVAYASVRIIMCVRVRVHKFTRPQSLSRRTAVLTVIVTANTITQLEKKEKKKRLI